MITQVEPVTQLQRDYQVVLDKLDAGPVVLSRKGKAAAVVLSVDEYDRMRGQIAKLERQIAGDHANQVGNWMTDDQVSEAFTLAGVQ